MTKSKWTRYRQLSIRIGRGKVAAAYLARINAAKSAARRKTVSDYLKSVIDEALEVFESGGGQRQTNGGTAAHRGHTRGAQRGTQAASRERHSHAGHGDAVSTGVTHPRPR